MGNGKMILGFRKGKLVVNPNSRVHWDRVFRALLTLYTFEPCDNISSFISRREFMLEPLIEADDQRREVVPPRSQPPALIWPRDGIKGQTISSYARGIQILVFERGLDSRLADGGCS